MISNGNKNSTIKPPQNKGNQGIMNPKATGVKTTSVSIVGGGIPKPQSVVKNYVSATPKSKISISASLKNKTIVSKSPLRQTQQIILQTSYNSARTQVNNNSPISANNELRKNQNLSSRGNQQYSGQIANSVDLKASVSSQQGGMRISKGAFNVNCSTTREPSQIMTEMFRSLELHQVQYKQVSFPLYP